MSTAIIGLIGKKQSGKSTCVEALLKKYPDAVEVKLAGKLKVVCADVFNIPLEHLESQEFKEKPFDKPILFTRIHMHKLLDSYDIWSFPPYIHERYRKLLGKQLISPRHVLQYIGTEVMRKVGGSDIHLHHAPLRKNALNIISDIRFSNELRYFKDMDNDRFLPIYINRPSLKDNSYSQHASEAGIGDLEYYCTTIRNDSSIENLHANILELVDKFLPVDNT